MEVRHPLPPRRLFETQPLQVTFQREGRLLVAQPISKVPKLLVTTVERTRRDLESARS